MSRGSLRGSILEVPFQDRAEGVQSPEIQSQSGARMSGQKNGLLMPQNAHAERLRGVVGLCGAF